MPTPIFSVAHNDDDAPKLTLLTALQFSLPAPFVYDGDKTDYLNVGSAGE